MPLFTFVVQELAADIYSASWCSRRDRDLPQISLPELGHLHLLLEKHPPLLNPACLTGQEARVQWSLSIFMFQETHFKPFLRCNLPCLPPHTTSPPQLTFLNCCRHLEDSMACKLQLPQSWNLITLQVPPQRGVCGWRETREGFCTTCQLRMHLNWQSHSQQRLRRTASVQRRKRQRRSRKRWK